MSLYSLGLLRCSVLPNIRFFEPTPTFLAWLSTQENVIDCGCGVGLLSSLSPHNVLGIDLYEREHPMADVVYGVCASEYPFESQHTILVARPDHSGWHYDVFTKGLRVGGSVIYVGLQKNYRKDLDSVKYEVFMKNAGKGGEEACLIKNVS